MAMQVPERERIPKEGEPFQEPSLVDRYTEEARRLDAQRRAAKRKNLRPVEGYPFWPHEFTRDVVIILVFTAVVFYLSAFMPYFLETPADPRGPPAVILPDWYLLWSYGLLKIANDFTIGQGFTCSIGTIYHCGDIVEAPILGPLNAKTIGLLLNGVVIAPLILVPFLDRGHSRRPVESPFWASAGFAGVVYILMVSVYSINGVINQTAPIFGQVYFDWTAQYVTIFQLDLLAWLTNLLPVVAFFVTYIPLKMVQKQHGYEAKLNASYYNTR
jgi:quinol-cytochrome oxidoreductase complex cytochrome b subunit